MFSSRHEKKNQKQKQKKLLEKDILVISIVCNFYAVSLNEVNIFIMSTISSFI